MLNHFSINIQTVGELTRSISGLLETEFPFVTVLGEISNLRKPYSGHLYFTLKDAEAQLKAVMFKTQQRYLGQTPTDGMEVICRGRISVYEARGEYQLVVDTLEPKGAGRLQMAFEQLKKKLAEDGLFDQAHKKPLPFLPERIALITSPQGAAVHDFLRMTRKRQSVVPIEIVPVRVQGDEAAPEIAGAIENLNRRNLNDVIVLCRGGGSLEDLWPFNEEKVARAIYASSIPVVSAIGHEVDFTIADFVADHRSATPTAAAEEIIPDRRQLVGRIRAAETRMNNILQQFIFAQRKTVADQRRILRDPSTLLDHFLLVLDHSLNTMVHALYHKIQDRRDRLRDLAGHLEQLGPIKRVTNQTYRCAELARGLTKAMTLIMERRRTTLQKNALLLDAVSPLTVLARGYSISRLLPDHGVVRKSSEVKPGDALEIILHSGRLGCRVTDVLDPDQ